MKRKRKQRTKEYALQKVVVSVKPRYFGGDTASDVIQGMLPPLEQVTFDEFGRHRHYCGAQLQSDSGDYLLFFETRWHPYRQHVTVLSEDRTHEPILLFACIPENLMSDFMGTYGYDIEWTRITEIGWQGFTEFVVSTCAISIEKYLRDPDPNLGDKIGVQGDMKWVLPHLRQGILNTGEFTSVEEGFDFPNTQKWREKLASSLR